MSCHLPNYEGFPLQPIGKGLGLGVCSKGVSETTLDYSVAGIQKAGQRFKCSQFLPWSPFREVAAVLPEQQINETSNIPMLLNGVDLPTFQWSFLVPLIGGG